MKEGWIGCGFGDELDIILLDFDKSTNLGLEEWNIVACYWACRNCLFFSYKLSLDSHEEKRTQSLS